jgi:hypothetical protein
MKQFLYASVLAAGCTAALAAQAGMADQAKSKEAMAKDAKTVTVTGCVAESDGHFMLNNATMAEGGAPMSYALTGGTLKPHVGHKVAVTGMMKPMAAGDMKGGMGTGTGATGTGTGMGAGAGATGSGATGAGASGGMSGGGMAGGTAKPDAGMKKGAMMTHGTVAVDNLKMIAATCGS